MVMIGEPAILNVKRTELNILFAIIWIKIKLESMIDTNNPPVPHVIVLGLLMLCVAAIIIGGYIHGHMNLPEVIKHLKT